jgi:tetratricopeptide (TPR) repeat protein
MVVLFVINLFRNGISPQMLLRLIILMSLIVLASCAAGTPHPEIVAPKFFDRDSRALYLYSRARLATYEGDYPNALNLLRDAIELDPGSAILHSEVAELKLKIGQVPEALEYINKSIKLDPSYRPPYIMAGLLLSSAGKDLEAADYLRKAVKLDSSREDAYLHLSISLTRLFEYEEAVSTLKTLVKINPDSILGYYYLGKTYSQMKLYRDALGHFKKALELRPEFDQAAIDMAATYEAMGDYSQAIESYRSQFDKDENRGVVSQRLIQLLIQQRRFTEALEYLQIAVKSGYGGNETLRKIGLVHLELEQFDEAIAVFKEMLDKDPAAQQIRLYLGIAFEEKGELDSAFAEFSKISYGSAPYLEAIGHIAFILKEKGKPDQAIEILKGAIKTNVRQIELYLNLAALYESLDNVDAGLAFLLENERLFMEEPRYQFRIGALLDKLGRRAESIERMKKVLTLNPKDAQALNYLGYSYAEMGINLEEALKLLKLAVEIRPNDAFILDSLGWVNFKLKRYDEAVRLLEDSFSLVSDDSTIAEHLGDAYAARREFKKALKQYRRALEIDPDRKELAEKIRRFKGEHGEK